MKVSVPAPPRPMTGDLALAGPATEGPSRDVQERRREPDSHPLTAGRARGLEPEALLNTLAAMPELGVKAVADLRAQGAPGEPRGAILDLAEIPEEPAIRGSMQSARVRNVAGTEGNAVHGRLPPGLGYPVGAGAPGSMCPHSATARCGQCVH
jgi:hypothetical protein